MKANRQRNRRSVAFIVCLTIALGGSTLTYGQTKSERFDPDGDFWILGKPPSGFEDFSDLYLNLKHNRHLPASGISLANGTRLRLKDLSSSREKITFTTTVVRSVSYTFSGQFLKGGVFAAADLDDQTPVLEGTLTKYKLGRKVSMAKLKFTYFGGT